MIKKTAALALMFFGGLACNPIIKNNNTVNDLQCLPSQSTCLIDTEFGQISVQFDRRKVVSETPFHIAIELISAEQNQAQKVDGEYPTNLTLPHYKIDKISSFMEGKSMFMGKIPLFFETEKVIKDVTKDVVEAKERLVENKFIAETMLGSCTEKTMVWRVWLTVTFEEQLFTDNKQAKKVDKLVFFDFSADRH